MQASLDAIQAQKNVAESRALQAQSELDSAQSEVDHGAWGMFHGGRDTHPISMAPLFHGDPPARAGMIPPPPWLAHPCFG